MKQNVKNGVNRTNRLVGRLAAEKKKTVTAVCLIVLMVFMWARVLTRKTPETAGAALRQKDVSSDILGTDAELNISFIDLPVVAGRNDILTRNFFTVNDWRDFIRGREGDNVGGTKVNVISKDGNEELVRRIAENLNLEAIGLDGNPQAFINNKLLSVGDKLIVKEGVNTYECEVDRIEENVVVIKCGEAEITLELVKVIEVND